MQEGAFVCHASALSFSFILNLDWLFSKVCYWTISTMKVCMPDVFGVFLIVDFFMKGESQEYVD